MKTSPSFLSWPCRFLAARHMENRRRSSRVVDSVWHGDVGESSLPKKARSCRGNERRDLPSEAKHSEHHQSSLTHVHPEAPLKTGKSQPVVCVSAPGGEGTPC